MHQDEFNFFGEPTWEELPQKKQPVSQDFYEVMTLGSKAWFFV